jgi:hypothetical protein
VPKKKNSIALFEVIQKSRRSEANMEVPKWMTGSPAAPGSPAEAPALPPVPPPAPVPVSAPTPQRAVPAGPRTVPAVASVPAPAAPAAPASAGAREWLLAVSGKRVRLSLTYPVCAAVAGGALVLLIGGFALGRWSAPRPEAAEPAGLPLRDRVPMGKNVLGGAKLPPVGKGGAPAAATPTTRAKGKWFLVIQTLGGMTRADFDEATRIADFCKKEGCPATVAEYTPNPARSTRKKYIVWSLTPFDTGDSEPAKAFAHKVEEIGKAYFGKYKTHDFRQKSANGRFEPWFEQQQR